jgi:Tfp pilus assembly protein PilP
MRKIIMILCSMLMLSGCSGKPTDAYKAYIECIQNGKAAEAFNKLDQKTRDMDSKDKDSSINAAKEIKQYLDEHKGLKNMKFKDVITKGDAANAKVSLFFNDGFSSELDTKYVKENGVWKVSFAP